MFRFPGILFILALAFRPFSTWAQQRPTEPASIARERLVDHGFKAEDLADLVVKDHYTDQRTGVQHTYLRQRWQGIEVFNGDIAVHQAADGKVIQFNNGAWPFVAKTVDATSPSVPAEEALAMVLRKDVPGSRIPALIASEEGGHALTYDGSAFGNEPVKVRLMYQPVDGRLRLVWNVNHYQADGAHWWNVRVSAVDGKELDRNDWVAQCGFDKALERTHHSAAPELPEAPAAPNDYNVYPAPTESPSFGPRAIRNAPWAMGGIASPYGWHDTNGAAGAEYTITRGNNVLAQEDANGNNGTGYSPDGGSTLDFDFALNLAQAPANYRDAALTNLFYWNNLMHDVWYQYGFDEVSGNFQQNNYGRGGTGGDYVLADGQDGSGIDNANFATPADGSSPRMQMFLWDQTSPQRDGDLDNGVIAHEYGHGISNRLLGGPSNVDCLDNAEQMGEGWSDFFALMMTMKAGDTRTTSRGMGTYVLGEPITGVGIRPTPYNTSFGVNNFTYAATNDPSYGDSHDIGFIWCTMLWEMTWDLVDQYGFDADLYTGTGGNNMAMNLVIEGLKLTACSPGFVDGRNAILQADVNLYGGANQNLIWAAFARRGLGYSASQGSSNSVSDQTEAYDMPLQKDIGVSAIIPAPANVQICGSTPVPVIATVRNYGTSSQSGFSVRYKLDGGAYVTEAFPGTLAPGATQPYTFTQPISGLTAGPHTLVASTVLSGDQYAGDDATTNAFTAVAATVVAAPLNENVEGGSTVPTGWTLSNPDNATTWVTAAVTNGAGCASTTAWMINYYSYNSIGEEDALITPVIDLSSTASTHLGFDHAYARYSASYYDSFRVDISSDCGATWTNLYQASGSTLATAADNTSSSWSPANCSEWAHHNIDLSAYDGGSIQLRFVGTSGYGQRLYFDNVNVSGTVANVATTVRMYLGGAYNDTDHNMDDQMRANGLVPSGEPYTGLGFTLPGGGGETAGTGLLAVTGGDAIVDWVVVELRSSATPGTVVAAHCALLQRDGDVVAADGTSAIHFNLPAGNYFVAVRHRNHLGCMTAAAVALTGAPATIDFGLPGTATYGTDARQSKDGRMMLWSGDVTHNGNIGYTGTDNDRDPVLQAIGGTTPTNTSAVYNAADVNLDGVVKYTGAGNDRDAILLNIGGTAPTSTRTEQLP
jgi:hypothetical protein